MTIHDDGFRYIPVNQFTPLNNQDWQALTALQSFAIQTNPWLAQITAGVNNRGDKSKASQGYLWIELVSYNQNIFKIRFQPGGSSSPLPDKVFGPVTQANIEAIQQSEQKNGAPKTVFTGSQDSLQLETRDLTVQISASLMLTVTRKIDSQVIYQSSTDSNGYSLLATFVDPQDGNALATAWVNNKGTEANERFYGQGEVNVLEGSKTVEQGGYYVVSKTGLAMTNFNYDQITYTHPELYPKDPSETLPKGVPNYYFPMYFSAPWIVGVGNQGKSNQYAYGVYLDNPSQSYTNTGDTIWGSGAGSSTIAYMGAQYGELDFYFLFGKGGENSQPVENVISGLAYLTSNSSKPSAKETPCAALPPKYIFGYFQGVYGAVGVTETAFNDNNDGVTISNSTTFDAVLQGYQQCKVPLEGFAIDIDVQNIYEVFTTNNRFWTGGKVGSGSSIFQWAHDNGLVTQTNITCFVRDDRKQYSVYESLVSRNLFTENKGADNITFVTDDTTSGAYTGYLQYGTHARTTAIFPNWGKAGTPQWWGPNYDALFDIGLDFVWQDMTTPSMDIHILGLPVTDDSFCRQTLENANKNNPNSSDVSYAKTFNWRSYHPQVYLTDPRYGDGAQKTFAQIRNLHAYSLCSATYNYGILNSKKDRSKFKRSYIIARGGQIGSQQFGGLWMGDNQTNWTDLNLMVPMVMSMNMSGVSVVGADVGGFAQNDSSYNPSHKNEGHPASAELITRWVQAAFLLPWFRNHYDRWLSLDPSTNEEPHKWKPKDHGKPYQELFHYTSDIGTGRTYLDAMISAIELRYRWQEVLYSAAWLNASTGSPMIKSMIMWDGDPNIDFDSKPELNSQFLLGGANGKQILAAPILTQGQTTRNIYFPAGANWFPYYLDGDTGNLNKYQPGGVTQNVTADIGNTPVYVQEGAVLPTRYPKDNKNKSINTYNWSDPFVLDVFGVTAETSGFVYIDDGGVTTTAEDDGNYSTLLLNQTALSTTSTSLTLSSGKTSYKWNTTVYVRLRAVGQVTGVKKDGVAVEKLQSAKPTSRTYFFQNTVAPLHKASYWIDTETGSVWIALAYGNSSNTTTLSITCSDAINVAVALS